MHNGIFNIDWMQHIKLWEGISVNVIKRSTQLLCRIIRVKDMKKSLLELYFTLALIWHNRMGCTSTNLTQYVGMHCPNFEAHDGKSIILFYKGWQWNVMPFVFVLFCGVIIKVSYVHLSFLLFWLNADAKQTAQARQTKHGQTLWRPGIIVISCTLSTSKW